METIITEVGKKIKEKDLDIIFGMTKTNTKGNGETICEKAKVIYFYITFEVNIFRKIYKLVFKF
jgi:hypothetical protein